jgi:hypothetical protein
LNKDLDADGGDVGGGEACAFEQSISAAQSLVEVAEYKAGGEPESDFVEEAGDEVYGAVGLVVGEQAGAFICEEQVEVAADGNGTEDGGAA